tara:strand:- start:1123 stop:1395 length:273 start_codon:yes stop_codon:yes gene_type:complete
MIIVVIIRVTLEEASAAAAAAAVVVACSGVVEITYVEEVPVEARWELRELRVIVGLLGRAMRSWEEVVGVEGVKIRFSFSVQEVTQKAQE